MNDRRPTALLVSYHAPPAPRPGARRAAQIARALAEAGWRVELVCAPGESIEAGGDTGLSVGGTDVIASCTRIAAPNPYAFVRRRLGLDRDGAPPGDGAGGRAGAGAGRDHTTPRSHRARSPMAALRGLAGGAVRAALDLLRTPDEFVAWSVPLARTLRRRIDRGGVALVVTTSPPHSCTLGVRRALRRRRVAWIADFRDPWSVPRRHRRSPLVDAVQRRLEARVLASVDALVANTPGNARALRGVFARAPRIEVVPNGWNPEDFAGPQPERDDAADVTYVGEVYPGMLEPWVALAEALAEQGERVPRLRVVGPADPRERRRVAAAGLDVRFDAPVDHTTSIRVMRAARVLLLLLPPDGAWATCVPSKLYPYLAAGRPILALVPPGDAAALVERAGAGLVLHAAAPDARRAARFLEDAPGRGVGGQARRAEVAAEYAWPVLRRRLADLAAAVAGRPAG